jgi:flagellar hook-associated protein 3 FlgL
MRVTFNSFPDTLLGRLQSLGSEQNKALTQLSTGQRISAPSDDAPAMQRILNLRVEKKQNQQYHRNATDGLEVSKVTFSSLEQIKDLLVRASELSANISGATSEQEFKAKASEIDQLVQQGLNVANTKLRGSYILAGEASGAPDAPFVVASKNPSGQISQIDYRYPTTVQSDDANPQMHIGEDTEISAFTTPRENREVADLLNKMISMRNAMTDTPSGSATKASSVISLRADLATQEDKILSALSRAGTTQYRLETAMKDLEIRYEGTDKLISTDADIDFAEATVRLNRAQMAYQAAIQSGARIQSNSLLDYLR